ncbi:MAG: hypothetical protein ACRDPK_04155 [Carbonactinosporaceae bacterium]
MWCGGRVGFSWVVVAFGESPGPDETVTYTGTSGYYLWEGSSS